MSYGKIYDTTYWGVGRDNTIGWGIVYKDLGADDNDADYQAVLDDATSEGFSLPSASQQVHQNTLVTDLKSAGVWDLLDGLWVYATDGDSDFATYNWIDADATRATILNAIAHDNDGFTSASGNIGGINLNHIAGTTGSNFQQNSASWGVYSNTSFQTTNQYPLTSSPESGDGVVHMRFRRPDLSTAGNRLMTTGGLGVAPSSTIGLMGMQKINTTDIQGLQANKTLTATTIQGDVAKTTTKSMVNLRYNGTNYEGNVGLCWVGDQFTLAQWSAFVTAVDTYIANKDS